MLACPCSMGDTMDDELDEHIEDLIHTKFRHRESWAKPFLKWVSRQPEQDDPEGDWAKDTSVLLAQLRRHKRAPGHFMGVNLSGQYPFSEILGTGRRAWPELYAYWIIKWLESDPKNAKRIHHTGRPS